MFGRRRTGRARRRPLAASIEVNNPGVGKIDIGKLEEAGKQMEAAAMARCQARLTPAALQALLPAAVGSLPAHRSRKRKRWATMGVRPRQPTERRQAIPAPDHRHAGTWRACRARRGNGDRAEPRGCRRLRAHRAPSTAQMQIEEWDTQGFERQLRPRWSRAASWSRPRAMPDRSTS